MIDLMSVMGGIVERGFLFSLLIMAMYLTSRVIQRDDLTIEGSFGLGSAVMALSLLQGFVWPVGMFCALIAGALAGLATGWLHTRLGLNHLISGIIVTTGLFSVNLKLAGSHASFTGSSTIFTGIPAWFGTWGPGILLGLIAASCYCFIRWLLTTEVGFFLRAVGENERVVLVSGKMTHRLIDAGFMLANSISAFCGALFLQYVGYFSLWANVGIMIMALAGLMLAELLRQGFGLHLIVAGCLYQAIITATFEITTDQDWNKLITALLMVALCALRKWKK